MTPPGKCTLLPRSKVLTAVQVFWEFTLCRLVTSYRRFEETYCLQAQSQAVHKQQYMFNIPVHSRPNTLLGVLHLLIISPLHEQLTASFMLSLVEAQNKSYFFFYILGSVHRNTRLKKSNEMQQHADIYLLLNYSTCFGRPSCPSLGVHKIVVAASGCNYSFMYS